MKYLMVLLLFVLHSVYATNTPVLVGDSKVIIQLLQNGPGKAFVHLHQNETTALHAAQSIMLRDGGSILTLVHSGQRNIVFNLHRQRFEFDPNRIFSDIGIKKTLIQHSGYTPEAHKEVNKLAEKIKQLLPTGKIIAVHNNRTYSLRNYLPGHDMDKEAQALHFYDKSHYRNFYIVTKYPDYIRLKDFNFNSVWQAQNPSDDGSLSVYLAKRPYVNVEAGYDQLAAQIKMLQLA